MAQGSGTGATCRQPSRHSGGGQRAHGLHAQVQPLVLAVVIQHLRACAAPVAPLRSSASRRRRPVQPYSQQAWRACRGQERRMQQREIVRVRAKSALAVRRLPSCQTQARND